MLQRLFLLSLLALWMAAGAQAPSPSISINRTELTPETPLVLRGEGFEPDSSVLVALTSPDEETLSEQLGTNEAGAFRYETRLETPGRWRLELRAENLRRTFDIEVQGPVETEPETEAPAEEETAMPTGTAQDHATQAEELGVTPPLQRERRPAAEPDVTEPGSPELDVTEPNGPESDVPESDLPGSDAPESEALEPEAAEPSFDPEALELDVDGNDLVATTGGEERWRLSFPEGSGPTGAVLNSEEGLFAGHGNSVLRLEPQSGEVLRRWIVSGPVIGLAEAGDAIRVTVGFEDGLSQTFTLENGEIQEAVRFGLEPEIFGWLAAEAQVDDPAERLERDPTNPWLYLALPLETLETEPEAAQEAFEQALERAQTFYDLAGISRVLLAAGQEELAAEAFDRALADFAARGYNPELLRDPALADAYNFPLEPLREAVAAGELGRAAFWAERLSLAAPELEGAEEALEAYADALEAAGMPGQADYWRSDARLEPDRTVAGGLDRMMNRLGASAWPTLLALLAAALLLYLTLWAKYLDPQSEVIAMKRAQGRPVRAATRVFAIRYFGVGEKLVLVLLLAAVLALVGLGVWYDGGSNLPLAARSGTLANAQAQAYLTSEELQGPRAAFIRGYSAQVRGEMQEARDLYARAEDYAPALNNLGVLNDDEGLLRRALALASGLSEARHNLGLERGGFPFQERYRPAEGVLALPTRQDFQVALAGSWQEALSDTFTNPWSSLRDARPFGMNGVLWMILLVLFLLLFFVAVIWLFIPRPGIARNAPRTPLYHLLALLIPGSGLADEAWGFLLLVPWAVIGLDTLSELLGWGVELGLSLRADLIALALLYLINLVAFIVEYASYRRRMLERRRRASVA